MVKTLKLVLRLILFSYSKRIDTMSSSLKFLFFSFRSSRRKKNETNLNRIFTLSKFSFQIFDDRLKLSDFLGAAASTLNEEKNPIRCSMKTSRFYMCHCQLLFEKLNFVQIDLKKRKTLTNSSTAENKKRRTWFCSRVTLRSVIKFSRFRRNSSSSSRWLWKKKRNVEFQSFSFRCFYIEFSFDCSQFII